MKIMIVVNISHRKTSTNPNPHNISKVFPKVYLYINYYYYVNNCIRRIPYPPPHPPNHKSFKRFKVVKRALARVTAKSIAPSQNSCEFDFLSDQGL